MIEEFVIWGMLPSPFYILILIVLVKRDDHKAKHNGRR